ncbi:ribosome biogenesis protein WDR12 homolog [Gigantopelta aegis]|uniref:ribosome biogenesis protein WDR12 homolog n=1 Tax=Gigantopelta aegis TaxID=1735272 RepID=UPI001B889705|nr:ribosome biogenesis protein WDR12 homolog [Gigantopelta aegis]
MDENVPHVQAKFFTKQKHAAVPDSPFSVPSNVSTTELGDLINGLLGDNRGAGRQQFDFLIDGEFLRVTLEKHLHDKGISLETVVEIEYVERHPAPEPENSLLHDDWVSCLQGNGQYILSGCYDNTTRLWTSDGKSLMTIPAHTAPVASVSWIKCDDRESSFITGSHDQTVHIWQWDRQKNEVDCMCICRGHAGSVQCVAVDAGCQRFCSGSWDKMLKLWSADITQCEGDNNEDEEQTEKPIKRKKMSGSKLQTRVPMLTLSGHSEAVSAVEFIDSCEVCTASWDHTIRLWDLEHAVQKTLLQGSKVFFDVSYSSLNRQIVAASADRHLRLYDPRSSDGSIVKSSFTSHTGWVVGVAWSPTNQWEFISGSHDQVMKLWDTRSPKAPLFDMSGHEGKILAVDWSIPDLMLSGAADNQLKIFKSKSNNRT